MPPSTFIAQLSQCSFGSDDEYTFNHGVQPDAMHHLFRYIDFKGSSEVVCCEFEIIRRTPSGFVIAPNDRRKSNHYIKQCDGSEQRFAYDTRAKAWANYVARKKRQARLLEEELARVQLIQGQLDDNAPFS